MKKALVLLSGGLDSCLVLAQAMQTHRDCTCLAFDYGQSNAVELQWAAKIASYYKVPLKIIVIDPKTFSKTKSALLSRSQAAQGRTEAEISAGGIPSTYVPARNTLFLAYAVGQAEMEEAEEIHVGYNALDINPYPDCRPAFLDAFQNLINLATKQAIEGRAPKLLTPLIAMDKKAIAKRAMELKIPIHLTFSCYAPLQSGDPCLICDACVLKTEALLENGYSKVGQ